MIDREDSVINDKISSGTLVQQHRISIYPESTDDGPITVAHYCRPFRREDPESLLLNTLGGIFINKEEWSQPC